MNLWLIFEQQSKAFDVLKFTSRAVQDDKRYKLHTSQRTMYQHWDSLSSKITWHAKYFLSLVD